MKIQKYQALGNDFIIIRGDYQNGDKLAKTLCNRHLSFGGDGLIIISTDTKKAFFYNQDGTSANLCGNALRCIKSYFLKNQINNDEISLGDNVYKLDTIDKKIQITFPSSIKPVIKIDKFLINEQVKSFITVDISNKHAILFDELNDNDTYHKFANENNININFVNIKSRHEIEVRTIERGVGLTLSCCSGALSSFIFLKAMSLVDDKVTVSFPNGEIEIYFDKLYHIVGDAKFVYESEIDYERV